LFHIGVAQLREQSEHLLPQRHDWLMLQQLEITRPFTAAARRKKESICSGDYLLRYDFPHP
jgi:hypothetical protein